MPQGRPRTVHCCGGLSDERRAVSCELPTVILNSFQDLSAEKVKKKARSEMLKQVQHDNKISPSMLDSALA